MILLRGFLTKCLYPLGYVSCWTIQSEFLGIVNYCLHQQWITTYNYYLRYFTLANINLKKNLAFLIMGPHIVLKKKYIA